PARPETKGCQAWSEQRDRRKKKKRATGLAGPSGAWGWLAASPMPDHHRGRLHGRHLVLHLRQGGLGRLLLGGAARQAFTAHLQTQFRQLTHHHEDLLVRLAARGLDAVS